MYHKRLKGQLRHRQAKISSLVRYMERKKRGRKHGHLEQQGKRWAHSCSDRQAFHTVLGFRLILLKRPGCVVCALYRARRESESQPKGCQDNLLWQAKQIKSVLNKNRLYTLCLFLMSTEAEETCLTWNVY